MNPMVGDVARSLHRLPCAPVSTNGAWDPYVQFFATGLQSSADATHDRMLALAKVQESFKERIRRSTLRADTPHALVDYAISHASFTVRGVEKGLGISYGRANSLVNQLAQLGVLAPLPFATKRATRRFYSPEIFDILTNNNQV